jgi:hypothetical protein
MVPAFLVIAARRVVLRAVVNAIALTGTVEFAACWQPGLRPQRELALGAAVLPWLAYLRDGAFAEIGLALVLAI